MAGENTLTIRVVTPEGALFKGTGSFVAAPAMSGEVGIPPQHTALIARLGTGILRVLEEGLGKPITERFAVRGGFLQVVDNEVTLLVGEAATIEDLDPKALETEREELLIKLQHPESDDNYAELLAERQWLEARENLVA
jgi:F-type H+-transporting ATPase subunit epsilon